MSKYTAAGKCHRVRKDVRADAPNPLIPLLRARQTRRSA